ncbi:MAG: response regulator [Candidatus Cloacimonetes bacterium]|nr:response regulator [Candidatus Cloacimonadota bacterium]MBS3767141.1 response regulator [Candidatus Cloacimonadota bacterium]
MSKKSILVVEDERIIAEVIAQTLKNEGYIVAGIESAGEQAVETTLARQPDMILMDIELEGEMNGIEAANIIKSKINIPVIYITAHMSPSRKKRAKIESNFEYIIKPFENEILIKHIVKMLQIYEAESE